MLKLFGKSIGMRCMKNCVNITWRNGFGNQLFQYAYSRLHAKKHDLELTHFMLGKDCAASLIDYDFISESTDIKKYDTKIHNMVMNIDYQGDIVFDYLENHLTYKNHIDEIKSWFPKTKKTNYKDLVVHIRRGDNGDNINTPFEWYQKVIELENINFDKIYIVTDTPDDICVSKFKEIYDSEIYSTESIHTWQDRKHNLKCTIHFIRSFDKILFSNSTFSWWASFLSDASEIYFNKKWQPHHAGGRVKLGLTDYPNWIGV